MEDLENTSTATFRGSKKVIKKEIVSLPEGDDEQKKEELRQYECDLVVENPTLVGINFDQDFIVDARNFWSEEKYLQYLEERDGKISDEMKSFIESGQLQAILSKKKEDETQKIKYFHEYLGKFEGKLDHVRIHPAGEFSPVSPSQAIEIKSDGTFNVVLPSEFIEQIKSIQEQCSDLTLVVQFYDHRRGVEKASDVPETSVQVEQYLAVCEKIIESVGDNIQLEIGNETNISRGTAAIFADKLQHGNHVDSLEYARFFFEVARRIKEKKPTVRISTAGVACFDPTYLKDVLMEIRRLQTERKIDGTLIDTLSFHPYRDRPENGSVEVRNGGFIGGKLDYGGQMKEMEKIASAFGTKLTVGEINFPFSDPEQKSKLKQAISLTEKTGVLSLIYPGINV